jgi:hypothetical protein
MFLFTDEETVTQIVFTTASSLYFYIVLRSLTVQPDNHQYSFSNTLSLSLSYTHTHITIILIIDDFRFCSSDTETRSHMQGFGKNSQER